MYTLSSYRLKEKSKLIDTLTADDIEFEILKSIEGTKYHQFYIVEKGFDGTRINVLAHIRTSGDKTQIVSWQFMHWPLSKPDDVLGVILEKIKEHR